MTPPRKVTLEFADNPLAGLPGQTDVTITITGDPSIPLTPDGTPDPALLESPAFCAAVAAVAHVSAVAHETAFYTMGGSEQ